MDVAVTNDSIEIKHAELNQQHIALKARVDGIERTMVAIDKKLEEFGSRPSWVVLTIITFLSSAVVGLLVAFLRGAPH
jgi:hypothetical protein